MPLAVRTSARTRRPSAVTERSRTSLPAGKTVRAGPAVRLISMIGQPDSSAGNARALGTACAGDGADISAAMPSQAKAAHGSGHHIAPGYTSPTMRCESTSSAMVRMPCRAQRSRPSVDPEDVVCAHIDISWARQVSLTTG